MREKPAHFLLLLPTPCLEIVNKSSLNFSFFLLYYRIFLETLVLTHGYMHIDHFELKVLWIFYILAEFCFSAQHTCLRSDCRLYQNDFAASFVLNSSVSLPLDILNNTPDWYTGFFCPIMSSVKNITSSSRRHADKPKARGCGFRSPPLLPQM